jgi:hypothetical protein
MRYILAAVLALAASSAFAQSEPTVNLSASPVSGNSPLTVTLTWTSTNATSCVAADGWAGNKAISGSQVVTGVTATTTFTLTCTNGASGQATVNWNPPTTNTDGSQLVDLAGYELYHASTAAGVASASPISIGLGSSHTLNNLPAGPRYVGIKARNSAGITSVMSNLGNTTVQIPSGADSVTVTVNTVPNPPVIVTVQTMVYDLGPGGGIGRLVGHVPLDTACGTFYKLKNGNNYHQIPLSVVDLDRPPRSSVVVAICAAA